MTEQTGQTMMYSRDLLLAYCHTQKYEPTIQAIFKTSLATRTLNERPRDVPSTIERSRNLRPEPKKQEQFLTPNNIKGKWKTKGSVSPDPSTSPTTSNFKTVRNAPPGDIKDRQWRPNAVNKENVANAEVPTPNLNPPLTPTLIAKTKPPQNLTAKPTLDPSATPLDFSKSVLDASARKPALEVKENGKFAEEPVINLVSASPETPVSSPAAKPTRSPILSPSGEPLQSPSVTASPKSPKSGSPKIIDEHQLEQRQKQIDYGHQTLGYLRYRLLVPKDKRSRDDPRTPKKSQACSKRSWDGQIKKWRRDLHQWDPEDPVAFMLWLESDFVIQMIKNNMGTELLELLEKIKERAAKFDNSPAPSPSPSPVPRPNSSDQNDGEDLEKEKIVRKLVF